MSSAKEIKHDGKVVEVKADGQLRVEIISVSACASCSAAHLCTASEKKAKIVEVMSAPGESYKVGDVVTFVGDESMSAKAVIVAYVTPLLLMVAGLMGGHLAGLGDGGCAISALAPLVPFYATLYILRKKISKTFTFRTTVMAGVSGA